MLCSIENYLTWLKLNIAKNVYTNVQLKDCFTLRYFNKHRIIYIISIEKKAKALTAFSTPTPQIWWKILKENKRTCFLWHSKIPLFRMLIIISTHITMFHLESNIFHFWPYSPLWCPYAGFTVQWQRRPEKSAEVC